MLVMSPAGAWQYRHSRVTRQNAFYRRQRHAAIRRQIAADSGRAWGGRAGGKVGGTVVNLWCRNAAVIYGRHQSIYHLLFPRPLGGGIKQWCCLTSDVWRRLSRTSWIFMEPTATGTKARWAPQARRKACMGWSWAAACSVHRRGIL